MVQNSAKTEISDSFEFYKFWAHNARAMANDKNVSITVTYLPRTKTLAYFDSVSVTKKKKAHNT